MDEKESKKVALRVKFEALKARIAAEDAAEEAAKVKALHEADDSVWIRLSTVEELVKIGEKLLEAEKNDKNAK